MMKKKIIWIVFILIMLGSSFFVHVLFDRKEEKEKVELNEPLKINYEILDPCSDEKNFYLEENGTRYYLSCITDLTVKIKGETYPLKVALEEKKIKMEDLVNENTFSLENEQVKLYQISTPEKDLSILTCKNNEDYYIGSSLEVKPSFCKRTCQFKRTYHILNIENMDEENLRLTVMAFQGDEIAEVVVKKSVYENFKPNKAYEFTFDKDELDNVNKDTIQNIFETFPLVKVEETKKTGLEQTQDEICKIK